MNTFETITNFTDVLEPLGMYISENDDYEDIDGFIIKSEHFKRLRIPYYPKKIIFGAKQFKINKLILLHMRAPNIVYIQINSRNICAEIAGTLLLFKHLSTLDIRCLCTVMPDAVNIFNKLTLHTLNISDEAIFNDDIDIPIINTLTNLYLEYYNREIDLSKFKHLKKIRLVKYNQYITTKTIEQLPDSIEELCICSIIFGKVDNVRIEDKLASLIHRKTLKTLLISDQNQLEIPSSRFINKLNLNFFLFDPMIDISETIIHNEDIYYEKIKQRLKTISRYNVNSVKFLDYNRLPSITDLVLTIRNSKQIYNSLKYILNWNFKLIKLHEDLDKLKELITNVRDL